MPVQNRRKDRLVMILELCKLVQFWIWKI